MKSLLAPLFALAVLVTSSPPVAAEEPVRREWTVDGVAREALVSIPAPAATAPAPVVFIFHGHGGTMRNISRRFGMHELWPEAIVVCPQGLNTAGRLSDPEGRKPGWQMQPGQEKDRDLLFVDAVLASLRQEYKVDDSRIFATGHSNGGGFTYLLWAERGSVLAAVAPSGAAAASREVGGKLTPKPALHVAGENDPLVKYAWQKVIMERIRRMNESSEGEPWGPEFCTMYPSKVGAPFVSFIHPGGHEIPDGAPAAIAKFFKLFTKP